MPYHVTSSLISLISLEISYHSTIPPVTALGIFGECSRNPISQTSLGEPYPKGPGETSDEGETDDELTTIFTDEATSGLVGFLMRVLYPDRIGDVSQMLDGFCGGRKTGEHGEKPSGAGQEPTTNSTHI